MREQEHYLEDIKEIREIMQRSSQFLSLSGLSGVMAGLYAIMGAIAGYFIVYIPGSATLFRKVYVPDVIVQLGIIATVVLVLALGTGIVLTWKKAQRDGVKMWGKSSRMMLSNIMIPLVTGGIFCLIMVYRGYYGIVAPTMLIFYGLGLINGSKYTMSEIRYLGMLEIALGIICALLPGFGLFFWVAGFGILHIVYGTAMYLKYERTYN